MTIPPAVLRLRVVEPGRKKVNLWLPIFILWPIALFLLIVSLPLIIVLIAVALFNDQVKKALGKLRAAMTLACSLRGLQVDVCEKDKEVRIYVY
jgi:hypothetical protein